MAGQCFSNIPTLLTRRLNASETDIAAFCQRWHVEEFALFGSVIRTDFGPESDIDVLVVFGPDYKQSAFDKLEMQDELTALFRRKVDVGEKRLIKNPFSQAEILQTHRIIYPFERANFVAFAEADAERIRFVRDASALFVMVEALESISDCLKEHDYERFLEDGIAQSATELLMSRVGSAASRLSADFVAAHSEVSWGEAAEMAAVVSYEVGKSVDVARVWEMAMEYVPEMLGAVKQLLPPLPEGKRAASMQGTQQGIQAI